jgi:hypothetical protein
MFSGKDFKKINKYWKYILLGIVIIAVGFGGKKTVEGLSVGEIVQPGVRAVRSVMNTSDDDKKKDDK